MMDGAGGTIKVGPQISIQVLKEPRGLIRVLQFVFAIFAFSTTSGFSTEVRFMCNATETAVSVIDVSYPFDLESQSVKNCRDVKLIGNFASQSQYFVATGVLTFLLCLFLVALYVVYEQLYQDNVLIPAFDFMATIVFTIFWLTSAAAWAQGVSDLKHFSNPDVFCRPSKCISQYTGSYATLNVSLLFGFLNFALWGASLWFIFKETAWFKNRQEQQQQQQQQFAG